VGGVASVLLPKTAIAHAAGEIELIRRYYLRGTLLTSGLLASAGIVVWIFSPWIFRLWLHDPMIATQSILPLVLIHTVVGGSSAVGRSVLLGMGKVRPFSVAVLSAGVANVALSYCFVRYAGLGLKGIILGTIVVVIARCAIWQPWYVLRTLKQVEDSTIDPQPRNAQTTC
jgi:O-antigen/teichoic acid export membrane protein